MDKNIKQYFCPFPFREMAGSLLINYQPFPGMGMDKNIEQYNIFVHSHSGKWLVVFLINCLIKNSSEYFLFL